MCNVTQVFLKNHKQFEMTLTEVRKIRYLLIAEFTLNVIKSPKVSIKNKMSINECVHLHLYFIEINMCLI